MTGVFCGFFVVVVIGEGLLTVLWVLLSPQQATARKDEGSSRRPIDGPRPTLYPSLPRPMYASPSPRPHVIKAELHAAGGRECWVRVS